MILAIIFGADGPIDDARSIEPFLPPVYEIILGGLATLIVFAILWKFGAPPIKAYMAGRTSAIDTELGDAEADRAAATEESEQIRQAAGDIDAERQRLFAEADERAEAILTEGRANLDDEVAEMLSRADLEIELAGRRVNDELRAEIAMLSNAATERLLAEGVVDDAAQQDLIESFIARVGASS